MTVLTKDEMKFMKSIDARMPEKSLRKRFNRLSAVPVGERIAAAMEEITKVPVPELVAAGMPASETPSVGARQEQVAFMFDHMWAWSHNKQVRMARLHDLDKAATGAILPTDPVTAAEKTKLEELAAKVIFEGAAEAHDVWKEFRAQETEVARNTKEFETLADTLSATAYEKKMLDVKHSLKAVWSQAADKIYTPEGAQIFRVLENNRDYVSKGEKATSRLYELVEDRGLLKSMKM